MGVKSILFALRNRPKFIIFLKSFDKIELITLQEPFYYITKRRVRARESKMKIERVKVKLAIT
jgi:TATA-binding protein-associated factor Taf7